MPIDFPNSPAVNDTFSAGVRTWRWDGVAWVLQNYGSASSGMWIFGSGTDGDVTISGSVSLVRDMNYNNLTIAAGAALNCNGYRIRVAGTLTLSNAPAGGIRYDGSTGGAAGSASGGAAGGSAGAQWTLTMRPMTGDVGRNGGTGAGSAGGVGVSYLGYGSTTRATSGAGGAGSSGAGGASGGSSFNNWDVINWNPVTGLDQSQLSSGAPGSYPVFNLGTFVAGGGGGGGDGTNSGGGGGGGGGAGGNVYIAANIIARGTNTTAGIIRALGGTGGAGRTQTVGNVGGGGGGCGGSGGAVTIFYQTLIGSTITNAIDVTGGTGGAGGNGNGTGGAGNGGGGGSGGFVLIHNVNTGATFYQGPTGGQNARTGGVTTGVSPTTWRANL